VPKVDPRHVSPVVPPQAPSVETLTVAEAAGPVEVVVAEPDADTPQEPKADWQPVEQ